ncbi:protein takeout-like [Chironomus tepperi]|uniref:protein takeout-like n=1 Tax=Chironomus tepperi TaxID=113505 RepID=UPI00391EFC06
MSQNQPSWCPSSSIERCKVSDETCILKVANDVLHESYEGNSDIALQSIDPIRSNVMRVIQDSGPVMIEATMMNLEIFGFSKGKFYKFKGFEHNKLEIGLKAPAGLFKGPYKINGKILIIPVTGEGTTKTKFIDLDMKITLPLTNTTRNGKTFYKIVNPKMTFDLSGGDIFLSHLSSFANTFINWSFGIVVNAVKGAVSIPMVQLITEKMNAVFDKVPYEELFLES